MAQFPGFNVSLRSGMFWHYLEPSGTAPRVTPENLPICYGLHAGPQSVLFRVSYYRRRINVEVSHMISDGRGALEFLKALLGAYVAERYGLPKPPPAPMRAPRRRRPRTASRPTTIAPQRERRKSRGFSI